MESNRDQWAIVAAKIAVVLMVLVVLAVVALNRNLLLRGGGQAFTNTNLAAPFSALGFLAGTAALVVLIVLVAGALATRHMRLARAVAAVAAVEVVLYAALLVGYSSVSKEVALAPGAEKYFCELDCHIAYTLTGVNRENGAVQVLLRTRFDEHTIAPWRGDGPLAPSPRVVELVDADGHVYHGRRSQGPELTTPLRPGESYTTTFVFNLPNAARDPRLLVLTAGTFPERVLIGNENSFLHRKISFRL